MQGKEDEGSSYRISEVIGELKFYGAFAGSVLI